MPSLSLLLQYFCLLGATYAQTGYLYTFSNSGRSSNGPPITISSETAYSIFCSRQGIIEDRNIQGLDEYELRQIEQYGGFRPALFTGGSSKKEPSRVYISVLGYEPDKSNIMAVQPELAIAKPSRDLLKEMTLAPSRNTRICKYEISSKEGAKITFKLRSQDTCLPQEDVFQWPKVERKALSETITWTANKLMRGGSARLADVQFDFTTARLSGTQMSNSLALLLPTLMTLSSFDSMQLTMLTLPYPARLVRSSSHLELRQEPDEELFDLSAPSSTYSQLFATNSSNHTLPSKLPACFVSLASCTNTTNHCSGHGTCKKSTRSQNCYKCQCTRTSLFSKDNNGDRTQAWAGGACQKKDISAEFTIFASFAVAMVAIVAGAIGQLWRMGNQELPSVIGAGVAGPRAHQ